MREQRVEVLGVAYELIEDFLSHMSKGDYEFLKDKYGVSDAVAVEIRAFLEENLDQENVVILPPPRQIAFNERGGRVPLAAYGEQDENYCWRVECLLWIGGRESEITAYFDLFHENEVFRIEYMYLGS
ncbi:hypothetical protein [Serratia ureilytica]|uniref:hypothetical protein n=1 Tax=Serratia ureilytica TaxID=300181 RepID=UPI001D192385|nr:hypothetical protein [Serratia ureilytica]MCC4104758.1 hypothetical protein [Serratia ureilytica]